MRRDILRRATRWCALCPPAARVSSLSFTPVHAVASHLPTRAEAWPRPPQVCDAAAGGFYRILGRTSVDMIKCGGNKLSALEIESHLLEHPAIGEVAVVGIPDEAYGQVVGAILVGKDGKPPPSLAELRTWARDVLAPYKVPSQLRTLDIMPRNAMGKVNKKELLKMFTEA